MYIILPLSTLCCYRISLEYSVKNFDHSFPVYLKSSGIDNLPNFRKC